MNFVKHETYTKNMLHYSGDAQKVWGPFELFKFYLVFKWAKKGTVGSLLLMLGSV